MVIWKFPIEIGGPFKIKAPSSLRVLSVGVQNNRPCFWASLNQKDPETLHEFYAAMTGEDVPDELADLNIWRFHGTVQLVSGMGPIVVHLFQKIAG